ncbi:MAG: hypothetical protein N2035_08795 [Chthoniobacterales bacterium]|nr:hypothetical protein [Chthoniobacterales bacterium]MCX7713738.1 hypothetical protein [Chthoniobacterales bacterium]
MKTFFLLLLFLFLSFLLLLLQETLPPIPLWLDIHFPLPQFLFCLGAITFPYPIMLILAFFFGSIYDLLHLQFLDTSSKTELPFGISIIYFLLAGSLCQGAKDFLLSGNLWAAPILFVLTTVGLPLLEVLLLSYIRFDYTNYFLSSQVFLPILFQALLTIAASSLLVAILYLTGLPNTLLAKNSLSR